MSCRLQSRVTAILLLTPTVLLCLLTYGLSVSDPNQGAQVGLNLQKRSKPKGGHRVSLEISEQQSNAAPRETLRRIRHSVSGETKSSIPCKSSSFHQSNDTYMLTPRQGGADATELFESDFSGFDGQTVQGKVNLSEEWLQMRPLVQCSPAAIILTAKGWHYVHFLVNRVGASPVSILHLPSNCGYNVKATWRDLVLAAPYDGCYVVQQNGSYVLPLLWWGMPVSVSCPMTPASAPATPSGFCSYLGITLKIEGSRGAIEKYSIKVNEEWVPLVSNTCAYLMDSAPEDLILFIPFTVQCAKDGGSTLNVILDGKMYILSCQPPLQQNMPMVYPPYQHFLYPRHPYYNHLYEQKLMPQDSDIIEYKSALKQTPKPQTDTNQDPQTGLWPQMPQPPQMPQKPQLPYEPQTPRPSQAPQTPQLPYVPQTPQPPQMPQKPQLPYVPQTAWPPQAPQTPQLPYVPQTPQPPQMPQKPQLPYVPQTPRPPQAPQTPQLPYVPQTPQPPQMPQKPQLPYVPQMPRPPQAPQTPQLPYVPQTPQPPQMPQKPQLPYVPQTPWPPQVPQTPQPPQVPQKPWPPQAPQTPQLPYVPQMPWPPQAPQPPWPPQAPQPPWPSQAPQKPQHNRFPVLSNDSSQLSPELTCKGDRLRASLPSAKIKSIKVKDVKRKVWVPVSSAPAHCGYSLQRKGRGVVLFSPLPACHSYTAPRSLLSLSLKFWDPAIPRHRAVRLQCPYTSPSPTMTESTATTASLVPKPVVTSSQQAMQEIRPSHPHRPSKTRDSPIHFQKPIVPYLYPPKPTSTSLHQTTRLASQLHQPQVLCHAKDMTVALPPGPITGMRVQSPIGIKGSVKPVLLHDAPSHCGYLMTKNQNGGINILLPYASCHMSHQDGQYRIVLKYQTADGHRVEALLSCQLPNNPECSLPFDHRLACGPSSVSEADCRELGCCYCPGTLTCYYPMDECTADQHFVFSVPASLTVPPLSPSLLVAAGNSSCTPQRVVADLAIFKIPLDGCGAHKYEVGNTVIYMLEILNTLHSVTLNYGTITRDSPFRLLIECRYLPGTVASVGYLVKSPSLGPSIQAQGVFGVQLRIAKDQQYSSYYPQYHRPLHKLLGKPLYLEVRLLNPLDPSAVLLVHYCVAYPRSAHSAWVLIYDGCPNPLDVTPSHEPPPTPPEGLANHVRRFTISTFQFLENSRKEMAHGDEEEEKKEEEIYFMCATEVCLPSEGPCIEGCIDRAVDSGAVKS